MQTNSLVMGGGSIMHPSLNHATAGGGLSLSLHNYQGASLTPSEHQAVKSGVRELVHDYLAVEGMLKTYVQMQVRCLSKMIG